MWENQALEKRKIQVLTHATNVGGDKIQTNPCTDCEKQYWSEYPEPDSYPWYPSSKRDECSILSNRQQSESSCQTELAVFEDAAKEYDLTLPNKSGFGIYRWLRWNIFSAYRRLFTIVFLVNIGALIGTGLQSDFKADNSFRLSAATATSINILVAIVFRNEHVINILYLCSSSLPLATPLLIRRWFAKIYAYGGIHSGCATAAVIWYLLFTGLTTFHSWTTPEVDTSTIVISILVSLTLLLISIFAVSTLRTYFHNWFECIHRFAGWVAIALFWCQAILTAHQNHASTTKTLVKNPIFWCLAISSICIAYPWMRLRSRPCYPELLSNHAVRLHFEHENVPYCSAVKIALNPLKETHAFAAIPNRADTCTGFSLLVSNAGDWTNSIISRPPSKVFMKGRPCLGVLRVAAMFRRVLIVATGSGIGPCLSLFHGLPNLDCCVLWSASKPVETYGNKIINDVLEADSEAVIIDTATTGRPNIERLTYALWRAKECEAVVVISNPKLTGSLVYGMETRGVPAYGPIFDS